MRQLQAVEMEVPNNRVPTIKKALNDAEVDYTDHPVEGGNVKFTMLLFDAYDVFEIGYGAGVDNYYRSIATPLGDIIERMEKQFQDIKKAGDDKENG